VIIARHDRPDCFSRAKNRVVALGCRRSASLGTRKVSTPTSGLATARSWPVGKARVTFAHAKAIHRH